MYALPKNAFPHITHLPAATTAAVAHSLLRLKAERRTRWAEQKRTEQPPFSSPLHALVLMASRTSPSPSFQRGPVSFRCSPHSHLTHTWHATLLLDNWHAICAQYCCCRRQCIDNHKIIFKQTPCMKTIHHAFKHTARIQSTLPHLEMTSKYSKKSNCKQCKKLNPTIEIIRIIKGTK